MARHVFQYDRWDPPIGIFPTDPYSLDALEALPQRPVLPDYAALSWITHIPIYASNQKLLHEIRQEFHTIRNTANPADPRESQYIPQTSTSILPTNIIYPLYSPPTPADTAVYNIDGTPVNIQQK